MTKKKKKNSINQEWVKSSLSQMSNWVACLQKLPREVMTAKEQILYPNINKAISTERNGFFKIFYLLVPKSVRLINNKTPFLSLEIAGFKFVKRKL